MVDKRCPLCGKLNPAEAEVCQFCKARLRPLATSPFSAPNEPDQQGETPSRSMNTSQLESSLPDWLMTLRGEKEELTSEPAPEDNRDSADDLFSSDDPDMPDWISRIKKQSSETDDQGEGTLPFDSKSSEQDFQSSSEPEAEPGELPDWLSDLGSHLDQPVPEAGQESSPEATPSQAEGPGWLNQLSSDSRFNPPAVPRAEIPKVNMPDWLSSKDSPPTPFETPAVPDSNVPDWLARFQGDNTSAFEETEPVSPDETEPASTGNMPDWLSSLGSNPLEGSSSGVVPAFAPDEEAPTPQPFAQEEASPETDERLLASIPDWMSQVSSDSLPDEPVSLPAGQEEAPEQDLIAPAELPTWLEAMRPVEAAAPDAPIPDEAVGDPEKAGPLAGLKGVLAAEPDVTNLRKPPVYTLKLQVTEKHQANMQLLENLVAQEGEPLPLPTRPAISTQYILRLVIAVALLAGTFIPLWLGTRDIKLVPNNVQAPPEVQAVNDAIARLPQNAAVLVAFEYQPGYVGELETSSRGVLDALMQKKAYLALVSTDPLGPLLAERMIASMAPTGQPMYDQYANFGYIPGGASALLAFAENPRAIKPYSLSPLTINNQKIIKDWNTVPALQNINSLGDFKLVVLIVDDPEMARAWIEQVQPRLGTSNVPFLVVNSAQAEAVIYPYYAAYRNKQVQGMISGMAGGAFFEALTGRSQQVRLYWDAYSAGLSIAAFLILGGGLVNMLLALSRKRKVSGGGGKP